MNQGVRPATGGSVPAVVLQLSYKGGLSNVRASMSEPSEMEATPRGIGPEQARLR